MGWRCLADKHPPLGLVVFQFYGKVGTEKTKSQGEIFMHMADALVTPAVTGTMYDLIGLLGMAVYLIAGFLLAELSFGKCLRRLRVVLPLVCMVGLNMDYSGTIQVGEYPVSKQYLPQLLFMVYQEIFSRYLT